MQNLMDNLDPVATALAEVVQSWDRELLDMSGPVCEEEIRAAERALGVPLPRSYRAFLHKYGAGTLHLYEVFGICRDGLWGDIVMMNQLGPRTLPNHFVKFTPDVGDYAYYLDTSRMNEDNECPIVAFGPGEEGRVVADSFLEFLRLANAGTV